jgi:hypothetical protein
MKLKDISEKYFEGRVLDKNLSKFRQTTPEGNVIEGYFSKEPNKYLGSFIITHVNDEPTNQFIQSMPKIHFYNDEEDICTSTISYCYEKLDGACLIIYPLKDENGNIIEIIPKTRNKIIADMEFIELFKKIDQKPIDEYYLKNDGILIFELYGTLNPHLIQYDEDIDIKLISVFEDFKFKPTNPIFEKPDLVFSMEYDGNWIITVTSKKFKGYFDRQRYICPTTRDVINALYQLLIDLNERHEAETGRKAIEGVVINTLNASGHPKWIKVKPGMGNRDYVIMEDTIRKEVLKYFDDYGSRVLSIYNGDEDHHTEYIYRMLEEEFERDVIEEYADKIEDIFMEIWNKKVRKSIGTICDDLIDEYADRGIDYCMEMFAKQYPMKMGEYDKFHDLLEEQMLKYGFDV